MHANIRRRIRDNLSKAFSYIVAIHVPLCGLVLIPVLLGWVDFPKFCLPNL